MYRPDAKTLHGWSYEKAVCFGVAHCGAHYRGGGMDAVLDEGALCRVCGMPAENVHHEPPGRLTFALRTPMGTHILRPSLIALCGSGTRGCHGLRHRNLFRFQWVWNSEEAERAWWSGELLSTGGYIHHDARLNDLGRWIVVPN